MANPGNSIENGRGHRIVFVKTAGDTKGELLEFEEFLKPRGLGPPEHIHLKQMEHFKVISGTMTAKIGGREQLVRAEGEASVSAGTPHKWWNSAEEELHVRTQLRPALHFEWILEKAFALMAKTGGVVKPEEIANILSEYPGEYRPVGPPTS
jgi:mannose-6-phosphate isomerase-like protein (cupin superfamily)